MKMIKKVSQILLLAFLTLLIFACGKKEEVKKETETTVNVDVVDDVDGGKGEVVIEGFDDAERIGDFLLRQKEWDIDSNFCW